MRTEAKEMTINGKKNQSQPVGDQNNIQLLSRREFMRFAGTASLWGASASILAACGVSPPAPTPTATEPTQGLAEHSPAIREAVAIYGATHEMESIDPAVGYTLWSRYINDNTYDALFRFEGTPPQVINHLAKDYEVSDDGLEWIFHLQENALFHDGTPVRASDVKYTFERMLALGDSPSFLWSDTVDPNAIDIISDHTLRLTLRQPFGPFLFTLPWLYIVNERLVRANETNGDWGQAWLRNNDAGSGPFYIEEFDPAVRIVNRWFEDYWKGWPTDHLTGWVYQIHREVATLRQLLRNGEIHLTDRLSQDDYAIVEQWPNIRVVQEPTLSPGMVKMNNQKAPTNNVDFRKAVSYAFDYEGAIMGVLNGNGTRLDSPLPAGFPGHIPASPYGTDLDKARAHLENSGFDPASMELVYNYVGGDPIQQDFGLVLQNSLERIGVRVQVEGLTAGEYIGRLNDSETAAHFNWIWAASDYPDAEVIFFPQYHSNNWGAWYSCTFYQNQQVDALIDEARRTVDESARIEIYQQLQRILIDDAADVWVYARHFLLAMNENLQGFAFQPAGMDSTYFYPIRLIA
jgi:peptide/nickel transport system substrate-binding protein